MSVSKAKEIGRKGADDTRILELLPRFDKDDESGRVPGCGGWWRPSFSESGNSWRIAHRSGYSGFVDDS